jgi:hypothetical protein
VRRWEQLVIHFLEIRKQLGANHLRLYTIFAIDVTWGLRGPGCLRRVVSVSRKLAPPVAVTGPAGESLGISEKV